jgi:hypothetical protein
MKNLTIKTAMSLLVATLYSTSFAQEAAFFVRAEMGWGSTICVYRTSSGNTIRMQIPQGEPCQLVVSTF